MALAAGIITLFIGGLHIAFGEIVQVPHLSQITQDPVVVGSMRVMIYQGGVLLMALGAIQTLVGLKVLRLAGLGAFFPLGIIGINFVTFLLVALINHTELFSMAIPQMVIFTILIVLNFLSLRSQQNT